MLHYTFSNILDILVPIYSLGSLLLSLCCALEKQLVPHACFRSREPLAGADQEKSSVDCRVYRISSMQLR
uniref:Uncharacterized protein n=1 Tax=Arundo donax TaxID=35708 RepID=A0A0A9BW24_ARUDO